MNVENNPKGTFMLDVYAKGYNLYIKRQKDFIIRGRVITRSLSSQHTYKNNLEMRRTVLCAYFILNVRTLRYLMKAFSE